MEYCRINIDNNVIKLYSNNGLFNKLLQINISPLLTKIEKIEFGLNLLIPKNIIKIIYIKKYNILNDNMVQLWFN